MFHIIHPLPHPFTQMPAKKTLSSQTIYIARKHKPDFHQMFTKHQIPSAVYSLSLEFLYSSLAKYQAQRKVLAFNQALLANRTSHHYVFQRSQSSASRISQNQLIMLPKLSSLPKSDFLIFLTEPQKTVHSSHFSLYYTSHSTFLSSQISPRRFWSHHFSQ